MMLENILADFELLDDWEDRYRYVIELGRSLPPLPEAARAEANKMRGRRPGRRAWRSRAAYGLSISSQRLGENRNDSAERHNRLGHDRFS
jgi:Fe-S metabolism associated domain